MNRVVYKQLVALAMMAVALTGLAQTVSHYELNVGDFSELKVLNGVNVDYYCNADSAGMAVFDATADRASAIVFASKKNRLEIQVSADAAKEKNLPTIKVYSRFLTKVENSGDSIVRVMSSQSGPSFKARLVGNGRLVVRDVDAMQLDGSINTGNGMLVLYGKCTTAKLNNTGTGNIQADELEAQRVKCVQVGTGSIGCYATEAMTIYGASGKVYYRGNPVVKNHSIGVDAISLEEN